MWHLKPMTALDLETTGTDVEADRIVTACVAHIDGSGTQRPAIITLLADPGVDIPAEATAVHGITTAHAREHGAPPAVVVGEVLDQLAAAPRAPIVGFNLTYDLTLLDRECRRHSGVGLEAALGRPVRPVADAYVLDKHVDRWRKGTRRLTDVCAFYGVPHGGAHDAGEDALAAARVVWMIAHRYPRIAAMGLDELHDLQVEAKAGQDASFASYLRKLAERSASEERAVLLTRAAGIHGLWPLIPYQRQEALPTPQTTPAAPTAGATTRKATS